MSGDNKYRSITVMEELYEELDQFRQRRMKALGVSQLSWTQYLQMLKDTFREDEKKFQQQTSR